MPRIASLLPSITEIVCSLGFESDLVGRSHECDFPRAVIDLPALTAPKLDTKRPSAAIDRSVKQLVSEGLSVYRVDADALRALAPSHILTQDQCEVCAASLRDVEQALATWLDDPPRVVSLNPARLSDVWNDVRCVAEALGAAEKGRALARELTERVDAIASRASGVAQRPRVACIEWIDPLMAAGNWMPEMVTLAGGEPVFGETGLPSPWIDWESLRAADADCIVVLPCGFDLTRTRAEMTPLLERPDWKKLRAVRNERVYLVDGNQYFNRPGPRLVESMALLAEMLHPDEFGSEHRGDAWEPLGELL